MTYRAGFRAFARGNQWYFFAFYLALFGSFCGLEIDTFVADLPFFQTSTFLLLLNVLSVMLVPPLIYCLLAAIRPLWARRGVRIGVLVWNAVYFHFVVFLLLYKAARRIDFNFYFFWYNVSDALPVLWKLYAPWCPVVALSIVAFIFLQKPAFSPLLKVLRESPRTGWSCLGVLLVFSAGCQFATIDAVRGSTAGFFYASFLADHQIRSDYHRFYRGEIEALRANPAIPVGQNNPSIMGDVIFFVKQESLNGLLVGPRTTPQFLRAAGDGILFPKSYANSIQSIRGYECILCGVPPNLTGALVDEYTPAELKDLNCLPRVFKALGYHPLYFFGGSRNARIMRFAESIGFEKVLADDIVRPGDIKFDWGYREDIFFTRVDEYLQEHHAHDKLFVFIDTGATNHTPFKVLDETLLDRVPFPHPVKFEERISNSTFVQDLYFGHFYDIFKRHYADRGSMVVASDHSWPIPLHRYNFYNERSAYEENFLIPMLFVPPSSRRAHFATGTIVPYRFSQMDIMPTVLDLIGLEQKQLLGESFASLLLAGQKPARSGPEKAKISVQPYGGGFVSVVRYPEKYLFDVLGKNVAVFDLAQDPRERSPALHDFKDYMFLIRDFFQTESPDRRPIRSGN